MNLKHTSFQNDIRFSTAKARFHMVGDEDIAAKGRGAHQGSVCFIFRVDFFDFSRLLLVERKLRSQPAHGRRTSFMNCSLKCSIPAANETLASFF